MGCIYSWRWRSCTGTQFVPEAAMLKHSNPDKTPGAEDEREEVHLTTCVASEATLAFRS